MRRSGTCDFICQYVEKSKVFAESGSHLTFLTSWEMNSPAPSLNLIKPTIQIPPLTQRGKCVEWSVWGSILVKADLICVGISYGGIRKYI